jgi:hypothetical protein
VRPGNTAFSDLLRLRRAAVVQEVVRVVAAGERVVDRAFLAERWRQVMMWVLPLAVATRSAARSAIGTLRPQVIVLGHDGDFRGNLIERAAAELGVPTAVVQHGVVARPDLYTTRADLVLSYHTMWHPLIASHRVNTRYQDVGAMEHFGLDRPAPSGRGRGVLVATNPSLGPSDRRLSQALSVCIGMLRAGARVTWRPHPAEREALAGRFAAATTAGVRVDWGPALDEAARSHAVTVVESSGAGIAALAAGRPVVVLPGLAAFCGQLPEDGRCVRHATSEASAVEAACKWLRDPPDPTECTASARRLVRADGETAAVAAAREIALLAGE